MKESKQNFWLKVSLYACGYGAYSDGVVIPLMTAIATAFPNASTVQLNLFLSGGSAICALIGALLTGVLVRYVTKRTLLLCGTVSFLIGGVCGFWGQSIEFLIAMRMLDGLSDGILMTVVSALIPELFPDELDRSHTFGMHSVFATIFSLFSSTLAGILCLKGWRYGFLPNALSVCSVFLVLAFVPKTPLERKQAKTQICRPEKRLLRAELLSVLVFLLNSSLTTVAYYDLDYYIQENGFGNSAMTGAVSVAVNLAMMASGLFYRQIYAHLKRWIFPVTALCYTGVFLGLYFTRSVSVVVALMALSGLLASTICLSYQMYFAQNTPSNRMGFIMSLFVVTQYMGTFAAPFLPGAVQMLVPSVTTISGTYPYLAGCMLLLTAGYAYKSIQNRA